MDRKILVILVLAFVGVFLTDMSQSDPSENRIVTKQPLKLAAKQQAKASARPDTLPLIAIMLNIEKEMQSISSGLWRHNFEQIEASAARIANHAKIPKARVKVVKSILGDTQFKAFVRDDRTVHTMAAKVSEAAAEENFKKTAAYYQKLERGCISCHRKHRTPLRESQKW